MFKNISIAFLSIIIFSSESYGAWFKGYLKSSVSDQKSIILGESHKKGTKKSEGFHLTYSQTKDGNFVFITSYHAIEGYSIEDLQFYIPGSDTPAEVSIKEIDHHPSIDVAIIRLNKKVEFLTPIPVFSGNSLFENAFILRSDFRAAQAVGLSTRFPKIKVQFPKFNFHIFECLIIPSVFVKGNVNLKYHFCPTEKGISGAPILQLINGKYMIVGINRGSSASVEEFPNSNQRDKINPSIPMQRFTIGSGEANHYVPSELFIELL